MKPIFLFKCSVCTQMFVWYISDLRIGIMLSLWLYHLEAAVLCIILTVWQIPTNSYILFLLRNKIEICAMWPLLGTEQGLLNLYPLLKLARYLLLPFQSVTHG